MKYQKSTRILLEAGEPTDPSRRRFLKTAGAAAASAAMPGELKNLANPATQAVKKNTETSVIDKLFQAAIEQEADPNLKNIAVQRVLSAYTEPYDQDDPDSGDWSDKIPWTASESDLEKIPSEQRYHNPNDYRTPQGIHGMVPWGEKYAIRKTPKGRIFLETPARVTWDDVMESVALIFIKDGVPQRLEIYQERNWGDSLPHIEIVGFDKNLQKVAEDWFRNNNRTRWYFDFGEGSDSELVELVDLLIDHNDQQTSQEKNNINQPLSKSTDNVDPVKAASNLVGLDRIKNLVKKLLQTDQSQTQLQTSAEKPAVPALPAPDNTQAEIMAQLRDIVDRDLTQSEKELVKREVEQEEEKLKKPPDESQG